MSNLNQISQKENTAIITVMSLGLILILGAGLRYIYLQRMILHVDEFDSLMAIKMILEKGAPILPTGIFHGKGLIFSYLGAGVSTVFRFQIEVIRYLSLALSVLTIIIAYRVTFNLFNNKWATFLTAVLMAIHPVTILWGARARMYSLAELLVFLVIGVTWLSLTRYNTRFPYLGLVPLIIWIALLSHLVTIIILPGLLLALIITHWLLNKSQTVNRQVVIVLVMVIFVGLLGYWIGQEPGEVREWKEEASVWANIVRAIYQLRLVRNIYNYFFIPENVVATFFALAGMVGLGIKARRRAFIKADYAALFVYIQLITTFLILYTFVPSSVRDERHNFIVLFPFFTLTMAYGTMTAIEFWQQKYVSRKKHPFRGLTSSLYSVVVIGLFIQQAFGINELLFASDANTYRYDKAMILANQQMESEDQLLSVFPTAAYLYKGPLEYYANQYKPRYLEDSTTGQRIDYYTGGTLLSTADELFQALDQPGRLWFVVDEKRLTRNYEARFSQEVLHQMKLFERVDNVLIFVERDEHWPMAVRPTHQIMANFSDQVHLVGYSSQIVGTELRLTLFWEPIEPIFNYKVFVHLRDNTGQTVAQADFLPFDDVISMPHWGTTWADELIPTGTVLNLPPEILTTSVDQYQLFIGLYTPILDFERVPVIDDISGENAVILTDLGL